jgi:hypothetical protein
MRRIAIVIGVLAAVVAPAAALGDSGGATIRALPESGALQASVEVQHQCPGYSYGPTESCNWFATAAAYGAESGCPVVFDLSHSVWVGHAETYPGTSLGTFAFNPYGLPRDIVVCLYVNGEAEGLVGQSHPFDRLTGREVLPPKIPATFRKACGTVRDGAGENLRVFIRRGGESCASARHPLRLFLTGHVGKSHGTLRTGLYWIIAGWRCSETKTGAMCTRGGHPVREWAEAIRP